MIFGDNSDPYARASTIVDYDFWTEFLLTASKAFHWEVAPLLICRIVSLLVRVAVTAILGFYLKYLTDALVSRDPELFYVTI